MNEEKICFSGREWIWVLITGLIFVALGVMAFSVPLVSTIGVTFGLAGILIISGVTHFVHAVKLRHQIGGSARFFQSLLSIVTGVLMLVYPGAGILGVALALSFYFFLSAVAKWLVYFSMRPHRGWGWGIASSIASFMLGILIIATFPFSALWIPGTLLGVDLIVAGATMVGLSFSIRKINPKNQRFFTKDNSTFRPIEGV